MTEKDQPTSNASYEETRIAPALETTGEGSASAEPSARVLGKQAIVALAALAVVIVLGVCVAFGLGSSSQQSANSAATTNVNAPAAVSSEDNKAPENVAPSNQAPDQVADQAAQDQPAAENAEDPKPAQTVPSETPAAPSASQQPAQPSSGGSASAPSAVGPSQQPSSPAPAPATITVSVYIDSSRAPGYPACMANQSVTIPVGSSVYDALRATGVSIGGSGTYVSSINGLAEKLPGHDLSGWMYSVNGVHPRNIHVSCGSYKLSGGESIRWLYTLNMGNDL